MTRKDRLENRCTHREYYAQFVTEDIRRMVVDRFGMDRLQRSTDPHLNDIPLQHWDALGVPFPRHIAEWMRAEGDFPTMAGWVCIAKEAARQAIESEVSS